MSKRSWVYIDGVAVEKTPVASVAATAPYIQGDLAPYQSMIDGSMIEGRAQHRAHLKQHGCVEVGNESMQNNLRKPDGAERRQHLIAQLDGVSHSQANAMLAQLRDTARFHNPHREK